MTGSLALSAYLALSRVAEPLARVVLARRRSRGKEDPVRWTERLGCPGAARPPGRLLWLHGASIGEALSILPVVDALGAADPSLGALVTTGTRTSAERMARELPSTALHQFVPVDTATSVARFLDHWRPDAAVWVESEFWPRLMTETSRRGVPMMLLNARISERSEARWRRVPGMSSALLGCFSRIVTQDEASAERLKRLGASSDRVRCGGNLKMLSRLPPADPATLEALRASVEGRPVWLASSTHAPEEAIAAEAHPHLARSIPNLLTIIAPRHPDRAGEIAALLRARGLRVAARSSGDLPGSATDIYLADTLGEMGLWYRLARVAFIGGSIAPMGGHNPFEPIDLGCAVIHGRRTENFAPAYEALRQRGGSIEADDAAALAAAVERLLTAPEQHRRICEAASSALAAQRPDLDAVTSAIMALFASGPTGGDVRVA